MKIERKNFSIASIAAFSLMVAFFATSKSARADTPNPIFQESFESLAEVTANGASSHDNLTFEAGKTGNGVRLKGNANLVYPATGRLNVQKGTIEFWIKPDWDGGTDLCRTGSGFGADGNGDQRGPRYILTFFDDNNYWNPSHKLSMVINSESPQTNKTLRNSFQSSFTHRGSGSRGTDTMGGEPHSVMSWKPNTWHKVILYWDFSLADNPDATHNSYVVAKIDDTYTVMNNVAPVAADAFGADPKIIFGQDHILGRYPADSVIDDFKIYDQSLLPVKPFPAYKYDPWHPDSDATFRQLFAGDGFCSRFENHNNAPGECPKLDDSVKSGQNLLFFQKPTLEQVYENTLPKAEEIKSTMDYQAAKGQFEDLFFNTYSRTNLNNVRVTTTEFKGPGGATIPRENLDLRVVKNWFQAGRGNSTVADQLPFYTPELLLHNDQIPLETDQTLSQFKIPSLPILDHVETKIDQNTSKQFVVIARVPDGASAGTYTATVTLKADGIPDQAITLKLEVLPFSLKDTGKKYTLMHGLDADTIYTKRMGLNVWDYLPKDMADIAKQGFNRVLIYSYNDAPQWNYYGGLPFLEVQRRKLAAAAQAGIKDAIIYAGVRPDTMDQELTTELTDLMRFYGFEPWMQGVDEIGDYFAQYGVHTKTTILEHIDKSKLIHSIGGKVWTSTSRGWADALADPNNSLYSSFPPGTYEPLDWACYLLVAYGDKYPTDLMAGTATRTPNRLEDYYWQNRDENPQTNRYFLGYFVWLTGLDGNTPTYYKSTGYHEFGWTNPNARFRSGGSAFASVEGPVPTMQGEGNREGIKDGKYLATWKYYKDEVAKTNAELANQSEAVVNNILERYRDKYPSFNSGIHRNSMSHYEADRKTIAAEIVKLAAAAGPQYDADLNADSKIDLGDFNLLKTDFLKLTGSLLNPKSDINGDGQCTVKDVGILMSGWR